MDRQLAITIRSLLDDTDADGRVAQVLESAHPADIAATLRELPLEQQLVVFRHLRPDRASRALSAVDNQTLTDVVQGLSDAEVSRILDEMPPDHAAEIVEKLPEEHAAKLLNLMKKERSEDVQEVLEYQDDSAGRLMSPNIVAVREHATVADAIEQSVGPRPRSEGSRYTLSTTTST